MAPRPGASYTRAQRHDPSPARLRARLLRVTLNRPAKRNALSREMLRELKAVFDAHAALDDLRLAVLGGAGEARSAPARTSPTWRACATRRRPSGFLTDAMAALDAVRLFPVPTVAVLNGAALGGGASSRSRATCGSRPRMRRSATSMPRSIPRPPGAAVPDLARLVGYATAMELLASARVLPATRPGRSGWSTASLPPALTCSSSSIASSSRCGAPAARDASPQGPGAGRTVRLGRRSPARSRARAFRPGLARSGPLAAVDGRASTASGVTAPASVTHRFMLQERGIIRTPARFRARRPAGVLQMTGLIKTAVPVLALALAACPPFSVDPARRVQGRSGGGAWQTGGRGERAGQRDRLAVSARSDRADDPTWSRSAPTAGQQGSRRR